MEVKDEVSPAGGTEIYGKPDSALGSIEGGPMPLCVLGPAGPSRATSGLAGRHTFGKLIFGVGATIVERQLPLYSGNRPPSRRRAGLGRHRAC